MNELLTARELTKVFKKGKAHVTALEKVNFSLHSHEILGVVGESGSGKSTLGKLLIGLLKPTAGDIMIEGKKIHTLTHRTRARLIQMIFQDWKSSLNPRMTIAQILLEPWQIHTAAITPQKMHDEVLKSAQAFNLEPELLTRTPQQLSGGQLQRVTMARALSLSPKILIADEPTSSLDIPLRRQVLQLLKNKFDELDFSLIFISHDMEAVTQLATRVIVIDKGKVVAS